MGFLRNLFTMTKKIEAPPSAYNIRSNPLFFNYAPLLHSPYVPAVLSFRPFLVLFVSLPSSLPPCPSSSPPITLFSSLALLVAHSRVLIPLSHSSYFPLPIFIPLCTFACQRVCAPRLRASERVSVYSTGSPWGSEVGYRVRERKRGRGGWAWFVFEVESTLHLLLYPISTKFLRLRIRHGILKLLKISIHTPWYPPFPCLRGMGARLFINLRVNRRNEFCHIQMGIPRHWSHMGVDGIN